MATIRCARCGKDIHVESFRLTAICPHCGFPPDDGFETQLARPDARNPAGQFDPNPPSLERAERFFARAVRCFLIFAKIGAGLFLIVLNYVIAACVASPGHPLKILLARVALGLSTLLLLAWYAFANKLTFSQFGDWGFEYQGPHRRIIQALGYAGGLLQLVALIVYFSN